MRERENCKFQEVCTENSSSFACDDMTLWVGSFCREIGLILKFLISGSEEHALEDFFTNALNWL